MRNLLQRTITRKILHDLTCNSSLRGCIKNMVLIFDGINIRIGTDVSSPNTTILPWPKVTHTIEEIIQKYIFKYLCDKRRGFQHIQQKRRSFHSLTNLLHQFCFYCIYICNHTCFYQTTLILFIKKIAIATKNTTLTLLPRVNNICGDKPFSPQSPLDVCFLPYECLILGFFSRRKLMVGKQFCFIHV